MDEGSKTCYYRGEACLYDDSLGLSPFLLLTQSIVPCAKRIFIRPYIYSVSPERNRSQSTWQLFHVARFYEPH